MIAVHLPFAMDHSRIVVTYRMSSPERAEIMFLLDGNVTICFLSDISPGDRERELAEADVLLSWNPAKELKPKEFRVLRKLHMLQLLSAGADHVPFREISRDVVVASNAGAYAEPAAEHVLGMVLTLAKHFFREHLKLAQGEYNRTTRNRMVRGSICGIVGFGGIGRATARLMQGLGVRIYALNSSGRTDEPVDFIGTLRDLKQVLSASDILVLCLPLNKHTRGLIGKHELELMKPDAILINVARGDIIDEGALYDHLLGHPGFSAGIDTWWTEPFGQDFFRTKYPFFVLPNILGSPHNAGAVPGMDEYGTRMAVENVKRFLRGEPVAGLVRREDYL